MPLALPLLLVACLLPRALMAWKLDVICCDGATYVRLAEALEQGDLATAFGLNLNLYPMILMLLHKAGLSWELGGKIWGTLAATLVVAPLYGWIRRQFDERVAIVACLLYAVQPELIEWSPELVRDTTFWLFFTVSLYFLWRAVTEVRAWLFFAAGTSIAASALTRFEGLFLLIPLTWWTVSRWLALREGRARLLSGATCGILGLPLLLIALNLTVCSRGSHWESLRLEPLVRARTWIASWSNPKIAASGGEAEAAVAVEGGGRPKGKNLAWALVHLLERGLTPFHGALFLGGYFAWHRLFNRRDHLALTLVSLSICTGIWIHLWYLQAASSRYVLAIVIMSTPCATLGLLSLCRWLGPRLERLMPMRSGSSWAMGASLVALTAIGWTDALTTTFESRSVRAELGTWIRGACGDAPMILGSDEQLALVGYYAKANYAPIPPATRGASLVEMVEQYRPDVIVVAENQLGPETCQTLLSEQKRLGLEQVEQARLPDTPGILVVLTRTTRR
jgi:dolichyl-phosphate-mannose-protein mannosyltransferase